jgi:anti-anti-sigma factor
MTADDGGIVSPHGDRPERGRVAVEHAEGVAIVTMLGEHDIATTPAISAALTRAARHSNVIVDLAGCSLIDSTVIGALIKAATTLQARGERLVLALPPEHTLVARVVALTRLADIFPVHASRADALASLAQP